MYVVNLYDDKTKVLSMSSNRFNYSVNKQDDGIMHSIRVSLPSKEAAQYLSLLASKLDTVLSVEVLENTKFLLKLDKIPLNAAIIDGMETATGLTFNLKG